MRCTLNHCRSRRRLKTVQTPTYPCRDLCLKRRGHLLLRWLTFSVNSWGSHSVQRHFPPLNPRIYATGRWFEREQASGPEEIASPLQQIDPEAYSGNGKPTRETALKKKLAATYLLNPKSGKYPLDPLARFHLGNGPVIHQLWAPTSAPVASSRASWSITCATSVISDETMSSTSWKVAPTATRQYKNCWRNPCSLFPTSAAIAVKASEAFKPPVLRFRRRYIPRDCRRRPFPVSAALCSPVRGS
jgi:Malonyl-CoA decarboxylase C-terminal domain